MKRFLAAVFLFVIAVPVYAAEQEVPVTRVTVFTSGVAYFEHAGKVEAGDASVLLRFKPEQIQDVLKSMVVLDAAGGSPIVNFAPIEPLAHALKGFGIDLSGNPTMAQILTQMRGTKVILMAPEKIEGKILSVEKKRVHIIESKTIIEQDILNLLTDSGIVSIPVENISRIQVADARLNEEFQSALNLMSQSIDKDQKPVIVLFKGDKARNVRIAYIVEAPVWKTSYRLVLGGNDKVKDKGLLQGWAIVENTSDADWKNIELTLVSGRPISFVQDLYTPLYVKRPVVRPQLFESILPQTHEGGMDDYEQKEMAEAEMDAEAPREMMMAKSQRGFAAPAPAMAERRAKDMRDEMGRVASSAAGSAVGELFVFKVKTPVDLPRHKSAMLPILNQDMPVKKVSVYNRNAHQKHPLNAVWFTNDSDIMMLAGPVTIFDEGTYAGDAQAANLTPKEKVLLSYAIDLKAVVDASEKSQSAIVGATINRGVLRVSYKNEYTQEYVVDNKDTKDKAVIIEHPRDPSRKLVKPEKPLERTEELYRFEVNAPAGKTAKLEVVEEIVQVQAFGIMPLDIDSIVFYAQSREIPANVRKALEGVAERKNELFKAQQKLNEIERQIQMLRNEQNYTRSNMNSVQRGTPAYTRFEKKLLDIENAIDELFNAQDEGRKQVEKLRFELEEYINSLDVK